MLLARVHALGICWDCMRGTVAREHGWQDVPPCEPQLEAALVRVVMYPLPSTSHQVQAVRHT